MKLQKSSNLNTCNTLTGKAIKRICIVKYDIILSIINACRIAVPTFKHNASKQKRMRIDAADRWANVTWRTALAMCM